MKEIHSLTTDDLRRMKDQEGLILQGCGGDPQAWVDGVNSLFTAAGILRANSAFRVEDVSSFQHDGLTCLLFPFEGVRLDIGRLAMWRLRTYDQFGSTWLSDYVHNKLGGFIMEQERKKPAMSLIGHDGNIFSIMGRASGLLKDAGQEERSAEMIRRVTSSRNYNEALHIISEYVETELPTPAGSRFPQKSQKKKGKYEHER